MIDDELNSFLSAAKGRNHRLDVNLNWFLENSPGSWLRQLQCSRDAAIRIAIAVVEIVLPEWKRHRQRDSVPIRAVEAAKTLLRKNSDDLRQHTILLAKGCTNSRRKSMGYEHRIAEAARAVANAAAATADPTALVAASEALEKTEEHILYRYACEGFYGKEADVRKQMLIRIANTGVL